MAADMSADTSADVPAGIIPTLILHTKFAGSFFNEEWVGKNLLGSKRNFGPKLISNQKIVSGQRMFMS